MGIINCSCQLATNTAEVKIVHTEEEAKHVVAMALEDTTRNFVLLVPNDVCSDVAESIEYLVGDAANLKVYESGKDMVPVCEGTCRKVDDSTRMSARTGKVDDPATARVGKFEDPTRGDSTDVNQQKCRKSDQNCKYFFRFLTVTSVTLILGVVWLKGGRPMPSGPVLGSGVHIENFTLKLV